MSPERSVRLQQRRCQEERNAWELSEQDMQGGHVFFHHSSSALKQGARDSKDTLLPEVIAMQKHTAEQRMFYRLRTAALMA